MLVRTASVIILCKIVYSVEIWSKMLRFAQAGLCVMFCIVTSQFTLSELQH